MGNSLANRPLEPQDVDRAITLLRAGEKTFEGARMMGKSYSSKDGAFVFDQWDDDGDPGYSSTTPLTEEQLRDVIAKHPAPFRKLLLKEPWIAFSKAFHQGISKGFREGDRTKARELLQVTLRYSDEFFIPLDAYLAWPPDKPRAEDLPALAASLLMMAHDAFRAAVNFDHLRRDRTLNLRGVDFIDTLHDLASHPGGHHYARALFHEDAGCHLEAKEDYRNALRDPLCMTLKQTAFFEHKAGIPLNERKKTQ